MMIPDLLSACLRRQFHTLPGLLDSWAALPNSYPNALRAMQGGSLYHFYDGLWYDFDFLRMQPILNAKSFSASSKHQTDNTIRNYILGAF